MTRSARSTRSTTRPITPTIIVVTAFAMIAVLAVQAAIAPPALAQGALELTGPMQDESVDQGDYTVRGRVTGGDASSISVIFAIDVSGSTGSSGYDCDGSGTLDSADDLNQDGEFGEILDCEIAGLTSLNTSLAAIPGSVDNISVGVVPFGSSAAIADVGGNAGQQDFVAPTDDLDDNDRDRLADVVQVGSSLNQGTAGLFTALNVGTGTDFTDALNASFDALENRPGTRIVYLLTDGRGSLSNATLTRGQQLGIEVRPFAITAGSDQCAAGGDLAAIAAASGTQCVYEPNPAGLTTVITGQPATIDSVTVSLDGGAPIDANIDPLGNFDAPVFLDLGAHTVTVDVRFVDGTTSSITRAFTAENKTRIVSMGDSYSAGEGITPFVNLPGPLQGCHQSTKGYPTLLGQAGYEIPGRTANNIRLDYVACSGAILRNLTAVPQDARGETHIVQISRVDTSTDLITFTIGGNDVGFSEVMKHCATQLSCWKDDFAPLSSGESLSADDYLLARVLLFLPEARAFYDDLRNLTSDNASVVALNYPELFDDGINLRLGCKEAVIFTRGERQWINNRTVLFRDLLQRATEQSGIWFVDVVDEFKQRRVCDGGINDNGEWLVGHETAAKAAGDASFHPNAKGAEAYARLLSEFLTAQVDAGVPLNPSGLPLNPGAVGGRRSAASPDQATASEAATRAAQEALPFPTYTIDTLPTLAELGLTAAELADVEAMTFGLAEVTGLAARRGDDTCSNVTTLGEHLVVEGHGFGPGDEVTLFLKANTETERRVSPSPLIVDALGVVRTSIIVPLDLARDPDPLIEAGITIGIEGTDPETGGFRRVAESLFVDPNGSPCSVSIEAAGDTSTDGVSPAPSAAASPGVPGLIAALPGEVDPPGPRPVFPILNPTVPALGGSFACDSAVVAPDSRPIFAWRNTGSDIIDYWVYIGSTPGGTEYFDSGNVGSSNATFVSGLATDGSSVYVRLWYRRAPNGEWESVDYEFSACSQ